MVDLITLEDAVREFGKSRRQMFTYLTQGKLKPFKKVGDRRTFLDRKALEKLLRPAV